MLAGSVAVKIPNSNINEFKRTYTEYLQLKEKLENHTNM